MVESPPDRPCPRKSNVTTPPCWFSHLATRQTYGRDHDNVKPCAMTIASSPSPGRCAASIGTPSLVTSVRAFSTGPLIYPLCSTPEAGRPGARRPLPAARPAAGPAGRPAAQVRGTAPPHGSAGQAEPGSRWADGCESLPLGGVL